MLQAAINRHYDKTLSLGTESGIKSIPPGLVESEAQFLDHLRTVWSALSTKPEWADCHVYVLRNLPKRGIGFFDRNGFYPDFLMWLVRNSDQVLTFVDPKGMAYGSWEKVGMLEQIRKLSRKVKMPLLAYIVTPTPLDQIPVSETRMPSLSDREVWLRDRFVFPLNTNSIGIILGEMYSKLLHRTP